MNKQCVNCPGAVDHSTDECPIRARFETYMLGREHPVIGWIDAHWLGRGDDPATYANDYVQGCWVIWQARPGVPDGWNVYRDSTGSIYVGVASGRLPGVWLYRDGSMDERMLWAYFDEVLDASPSDPAAATMPAIVLPMPVMPEQPEDAVDDSWMDGYNAALRMREQCQHAIEAAGIQAGQAAPAVVNQQVTTATVKESLSVAARDVLAERQRQITAEGWSPEHDDEHDGGELSNAASCYARLAHNDPGFCIRPAYWPWDKSWWKPSTPRHNLIRAGALILAEIERLDRAEQAKQQEVQP